LCDRRHLRECPFRKLSNNPESEFPKSVKAYSTLGGVVARTVRVTIAPRSSPSKVRVNIRWEIRAICRFMSLNRRGLPCRLIITCIIHSSPIRLGMSLTPPQFVLAELVGAIIPHLTVS
jgi:hypothetical protein